MQDSVLGQIGILCRFHHSLFVCKVIARISQEPAQQLANNGSRLAFHHGCVKVVDGVKQNSVLLVDGFDPDGEVFRPDYKCHAVSPAGTCR
jgi:hypothetical protein